MTNHRIAAAMLMAVCAPIAPTKAQSTADSKLLVEQLKSCRAITDDAKRLNCYDENAGALLDARESNDIVILDRNDVRQAKKKLFGFSLPKINLFGDESDNDSARVDEPEIQEIDSTIAQVKSAGTGKWLFVLADGTAWQTTESSSRIYPQANDAIHIEAGLLGSYKAKVGGRATVRVKRVR